MKTFVCNHKRALVIAVALLLIGWWPFAPVRGCFAAWFDVARGHYKVLSFGLPAKWRPDYARLLQERYSIEQRTVAGCLVSRSLVAYVSAYNEVSRTAAKQKFGHDVFAECAADARKAWEVKNSATETTTDTPDNTLRAGGVPLEFQPLASPAGG